MAIYSEFSPLKMVIFHNYVSLPEGNLGVSKYPYFRKPPNIGDMHVLGSV